LNVAGLKQAVGGVDADTLEILAGLPPGFAMLCGDDPFIYPMTLMGGAGSITASAHVCTARFVAMVDCALGDKLDEGRAYAQALLPVCKTLFAEPSPGVIKGVLHAQGRIPTPDLRLPMTAGSQAAVDAALAAVDTASR
jgi:4-hydroxy-tetrahydrodipicolinate synthase